MICYVKKRGRGHWIMLSTMTVTHRSVPDVTDPNLGSCWGMEEKWCVQETSSDWVTAGNMAKQIVG